MAGVIEKLHPTYELPLTRVKGMIILVTSRCAVHSDHTGSTLRLRAI